MGITEETDAIVIVVSEERGSISFCFNGNIISNLDGPKLRAALEGVFQPRRTKVRRAWWSRAAHEPASPQPQAAAAPPAPPSSVAAADSVPPPAPEPSGIEFTPAPLRKRGDAEVSEPPKPLRKSSEGKEAKAGDSQSRPPTPLRKSSDSRAGESRGSEPPRSTRAAGLPELPRPPASVVPTPLRHLAPPPQRRDSAPTPEPVSVRHPGSTPMPRAEAPDSASREAEPPELKSTGTETPLPNDQEAKDSVHHEGGSR
jgi:diadenylate cyclase